MVIGQNPRRISQLIDLRNERWPPTIAAVDWPEKYHEEGSFKEN